MRRRLAGEYRCSPATVSPNRNPSGPGYIRSGTKINIQAARCPVGADKAGEARSMLPLGQARDGCPANIIHIQNNGMAETNGQVAHLNLIHNHSAISK